MRIALDHHLTGLRFCIGESTLSSKSPRYCLPSDVPTCLEQATEATIGKTQPIPPVFGMSGMNWPDSALKNLDFACKTQPTPPHYPIFPGYWPTFDLGVRYRREVTQR